MAIKKKEKGKVVVKNINGTIFDVRLVPNKKGHGKDQKWISSSYVLCLGKSHLKSGFKNIEEAGKFATENISKYNKKTKTFS